MDNKSFKQQYEVNIAKEIDDVEEYKFNPNSAFKEIAHEQLLEFAKRVKDTPQQDLIAFWDPKVRELLDYFINAVMLENERINSDSFPLQTYRRYKSDESSNEKFNDYAEREDKKDQIIPDYFAIRIVPEAEHSIFFADGDPELQQMIDKREKIRQFVVEKYKMLSEKPNMTCEEYGQKCKEVLEELKSVFPVEAKERKKHYNELIKVLRLKIEEYKNTVEDPNELMNFNDIADITGVNIRSLLVELKKHYPNEVTLYKLRNDLMNTFENSELIKSLRNISFI